MIINNRCYSNQRNNYWEQELSRKALWKRCTWDGLLKWGGKKGIPWKESGKSVFMIWSENYEETHLVETEGLCWGVVKNKMGSQPLECL